VLAPSKSFEITLETRGLARKTLGALNHLEPYGNGLKFRAEGGEGRREGDVGEGGGGGGPDQPHTHTPT
jgi:hypothetical protein